MANYDVNDIVEVKKRQKRRKKAIKLLIFCIIMLIIGGLYYYREKWLPGLQGIGQKYQTIINDGELATGNFPIEISGSVDYQVEYSESVMFVLSDAYTCLYNEDGGLMEKRQHAYTNAVLRAAGGKALIYEHGGTKFRVEGVRKTIYTDIADDTIIFARISSDGYVAVVSSSEKYSCTLSVYDDDGNFIYGRDCIERLIDVSFTEDSMGAILSYVGAENGEIVTTATKISFTEEDAKWTTETLNTFCLGTYAANGGAVVLGDTHCAYYNNKGELKASYEYDGTIAGCDSKGEKLAVIFNDDERRKYSIMTVKDSKSEPFIITSEEPLKYVQIYDGLVYVMDRSQLRAYDFDGNLRSTVEISDSYSQFRRCDSYIFLMSYDRIDRIDYES